MPSLRGEISNGGSLQDIKSYCDNVHGIIHDGLGIPPEGLKDRVTRIFGADRCRKAGVWELDWTGRGFEYIDQVIFDPSGKQMRDACVEILNLAGEYGIPVKKVVARQWANSAWIPWNDETPLTEIPFVPEGMKGAGRNILSPKLRLIISPDKLGSGPSSKEKENSIEAGFLAVAERIAGELSLELGLPEGLRIKAEIEKPVDSDLDVNAVFDCDLVRGGDIPKEVLSYMAEATVASLRRDPLTKGGVGEVWIRHGRPDKMVVVTEGKK